MSGPLAGLRAIELAHEHCAWAGKLLADLGVEVILVEPPGGCVMRDWPPFLDDGPGLERSLAHWHYNANKLGVLLDLDDDPGQRRFVDLVAGADILIEGHRSDYLLARGIGYERLATANPGLITASITPFGQRGPRWDEEAIDLTLFAGGGPAWNCGYDDHSLPPVRGGGNQGYHTACHYAVMSILVAVLHRDLTGEGQFIDVNAHAAANVTTEAGSYQWLVAQETVQRQTGRHAGVNPTMPSQVECADGRYVNTGIPPRRPHEFAAMAAWLRELGLLDEFPGAALLELGAEREQLDLSRLAEDEEIAAIFGAGRDAVNFIAAHVPAYEFFTGGQARGMQVGIVYSPEEAIADPHIVARGFPVGVDHPELMRTITYPGAPYKFSATPWELRHRAPTLGEHNAQVFGHE